MIFKKKNTDTDDTRKRRSDKLSRAKGYSYYSNRQSRETGAKRVAQTVPQVKNKNLINILKNSPSILAILVILGSIVYALFLNTSPKIEIIGSSDQNFVQPISLYQETASKDLKESFFNRIKITIDTDKIENQLKSQFPELSGVSVVIPPVSHQLRIEIQASASSVILSNKQGNYLINQNGIAILKLSSGTSQYTLPVVTDDSGLDIKPGETILTTSDISFINTIAYQLQAKNLPIQSITLSTTPYELDVQVRREPYYIKFDLQNSALYEIGTYFATVKLFGSSPPAHYVDVRIPGRAYYQ